MGKDVNGEAGPFAGPRCLLLGLTVNNVGNNPVSRDTLPVGCRVSCIQICRGRGGVISNGI